MNYDAIALWSQVIAAVVFAALIVIGFMRYLTPTIARMTAAKNDEIHENETRRDEATQRVAAARAEIAEATTDAARIKEHIERDARREAAIIVATAHSEAQRLVRNAHADYERSRVSARDRLRVEMIDKALAAARKTVAGRIDEKAEATLVGRFIGELERKEAASGQ
jgi:F-type H+-transporting ATPase subunit b